MTGDIYDVEKGKWAWRSGAEGSERDSGGTREGEAGWGGEGGEGCAISLARRAGIGLLSGAEGCNSRMVRYSVYTNGRK